MTRQLLLAAIAVLAALAVGCGDDAQDAPAVTRPAEAVHCPDGESGGFDARELLGLSEADAAARAKREGCTTRVVERDGEQFAVTMDYNPKRVNVVVADDTVTAITGVG